MNARLHGKIAIVTGAASGIGAATARLFAQHGAQVIGIDCNHANAFGERLQHLVVDVTDVVAIAAALAQVVKRHERVDELANVAGTDVFSEPLALSDADWERCLALNLKGAWKMARAALPSMVADILIDGGRSQLYHE